MLAVGLVGAGAPAGAAARSSSGRSASCPDATTPVLQLTVERAQAATLCLVNEERRRRRLPPLRLARPLQSAATAFAADMVGGGFFDHTAPDGSLDFVSRMRASGYARAHQIWSAGEDLAWGVGEDARPAAIVRMWLLSGPHRRNMLHRQFREVGIGVDFGVPYASAASDARAHGGLTYVIDFGFRRRSVAG